MALWPLSTATQFVGRERELAMLRAQLDAARAGHGSIALLVGEPGIGKTRLAEELATYAGFWGVQVLWGRCCEGDGAPAFWPWWQVLRAYLRDHDSQALRADLGPGAGPIAQSVPELRERLPDLTEPPPLAPVPARFRLFDSFTGFLKRAAARQPLRGPSWESLVAAVYQETEGNPFFVAQLIRLLATEGRLADPTGGLLLLPGVRAVIDRRLGHLSPACHESLTYAAVLGREFSLRILARVSALANEPLLAALDEAIAARIVTAAPGAIGRYRFVHALIRETLYEALGAATRVRLHRQTGEALEALHQGNLDPYLAILATTSSRPRLDPLRGARSTRPSPMPGKRRREPRICWPTKRLSATTSSPGRRWSCASRSTSGSAASCCSCWARRRIGRAIPPRPATPSGRPRPSPGCSERPSGWRAPPWAMAASGRTSCRCPKACLPRSALSGHPSRSAPSGWTWTPTLPTATPSSASCKPSPARLATRKPWSRSICCPCCRR